MDQKFGQNMKRLTGKIAVYGMWILIVLLAFSAVRGVNTAARVRAQIAADQDKVAKMQKDNDDLQNKILLTQGSDYMEREIRNKLGLVKSGEAIVVLPDADILRKLAPPNVQDTESLPDPNWRKWEKLFF